MKVLFLGNSSEVYGDISENDRRASMVSDALEAELGEPVDVQVRTIWPSSRLPAAIDKWMTEFQPDIVYLNVIAFWFNYESVPLKFERMFGRAGKPFKSAGIKAAQIPWLGHTRVFHWSRARIQSAIGGATFFEPGEVVKVISDCVRVVVRHEESLLVVKGPRANNRYGSSERSLAWAEERRLRVHGALARLSGELHVDYVGAEKPRYLTEPAREKLGDRLHGGRAEHARSGAEIAELLKAAWDRRRSGAEVR